MKILHILNELQPSGAEVMLKVAAPHWRKLGVKSDIVATGKNVGSFAKVLEEAGFGISHLPLESRSAFASPKNCRALLQLFRDYDVIHIHPEGKAPFLATLAYLAGRKRIVRTVHNNFVFSARIRFRLRLERWWLRLLGGSHVAISPSVQETEWNQFKNPTSLINNWIDTDHFRPPNQDEREKARNKLGLPTQTKLLVSVGNGSDVKNYKAIVEALAKLNNPELLYFQVGNEHASATDRETTKSLGLGTQVRFIGPVDDPRKYLWAADLYLMPSKFEGFGLAAAEALACGLRCVFSEAPGLLDWKPRTTQVTWCQTDYPSVAQAIQKALIAIEPIDILNISSIMAAYSAKSGANAYAALYRCSIVD